MNEFPKCSKCGGHVAPNWKNNDWECIKCHHKEKMPKLKLGVDTRDK